MLKLFKADIKVKQNTIVIKGGRRLVSPGIIDIPGDISSAAFFMVLAAIIPDAQVLIRNISLNPSRMGIIRVLKRMGANIKVTKSQSHKVAKFEPAGDIKVTSSRLKGTIVRKQEIPALIDELPVLLVAACNARGKTVFEGVQELRVKETDRIKSMSENLKKMGADLKTFKHGTSEKIVIRGLKQLKGSSVKSFSDHRTAMSMLVAGMSAAGNTRLDDISCINKSFPGFLSLLKKLIP
jgi:3-phosphoshikimate 1-carboxyvinyltransferase